MATPAATIDISTLLWMMPSPSGGRLCLAESGVSVRTIQCLYNDGWTPEQILEDRPHLNLPAIYAAISYYLANKERMDDALAEDERRSEEDRLYYEKHGKLPPLDE